MDNDPSTPSNGRDRRATDPQQISQVIDLLSKAASGAENLSEKIDLTEENRLRAEQQAKRDHRLQLVSVACAAFSAIALAVIIPVLITVNRTANNIKDIGESNTKINQSNNAIVRRFDECTTADPDKQSPPRKAVDKEDEKHECFNNSQANANAFFDSNHNGKSDLLEILEALGVK